jgi:hypothetical protein
VRALLLEGQDRLPRDLDLDRHVTEELAAGVGHEGALIADDRVADAGLLEVGPDRAEHAAGDDDEGNVPVASGADRRDRPRRELRVLADQGAVEIARDRGDRAWKMVRKPQPEVLSTT